MLEDKKEILDKNSFLNMRKHKKILSIKEKNNKRYLILSVFLSLLVISLFYFLSDASNIYRITIEGNNYLSDDDILQLSEISTKDKYLFTIPAIVENKINKNLLVNSSKVELLDDRLVRINVVEKKIVGYTLENSQSVLITDNDERISLDRDNLYIINSVPLIEGFSNEDLILIEKNLVECDYSIINEISEIHYYPDLKYQNVQVIMRDGNNIFTSAYGLNLLNRYYDMESSYARDSHNCYYFEDISGNAYTSSCPWEPDIEVEIVQENDYGEFDDYEYYEDEDYYEEDE